MKLGGIHNLLVLLFSSWLSYCLAEDEPTASLGDLAKVFAMLAGGGECKLKCPNGVQPEEDPHHEPTGNGCGSMGMKIDVSDYPGFEDCCNTHDKCYDKCNSDRAKCDETFKSCLHDACFMGGLEKKHSKKKQQTCKNAADLMHSGTVGLGCIAFKEAQRNACLCSGKKLSKEEMQKLDEAEEL